MLAASAWRAPVALVERLSLLARVGWQSRRLGRARSAASREKARAAIFDLLGQARGLALKAGQIAAGSEGSAIGRAIRVPARPLPTLLPTLERSLGRRATEVFAEIDPVGIAASLGQVHRAQLWRSDGRIGRSVAVKIRDPRIRQSVAAELRLAGLLPGAGPVKVWGFDLDGYKRFLREELEEELDYRGEAERQRLLRQELRVPGLIVPRVDVALSREAMLIQDWEDGEPLLAAVEWPRRDRLAVARILLEAFLKGLFSAGLVHADPNPGNVAVRRGAGGSPEVVLFDAGSVLRLGRLRRLALLRLVVDLREGRPTVPLALLVAAGFDATRLAHLESDLEPLLRTLLEPFLSDRPFDPRDWDLRRRLDDLLGELKWWFRSAGPPDLILAVRALNGLLEQLRMLDARLPWWPLLVRSVGEKGLEEARAYEPAPIGTEESTRARAYRRLERPARLLKVRVEEAGGEIRDVSLPASEVAELDRLVPAEVRRRLARDGVDLVALGTELWRQGLRPREVLTSNEGRTLYRVWLE